MYHRLFAIMITLLLTYGAGNAFAYTLLACGSTNLKWASNTYATSASAVGFPVGPWRDALASVVSRWANNPSLLNYTVAYGDPSVGLGNGQSETWWSSGFGAPAVANWWFNTSTCRFNEVDIRFDNTVPYHYTTTRTSLWPYGGASRPFQTTAMHEFGHAGGLGHTANTYNIMGADWTHIYSNGATAIAYPGEDASQGMVALYGLWATGPQDVSVVHWRWLGNSGAYSTHARTRIFSITGIELPKVCATCADPVYKVTKGQVVQLELSYENLGRSSQIPSVGYYVSTNNIISTADTLISSTSLSLARDTVFLFKRTLTIPTNLVSGTNYWLGAIIDRTGALPELNEANNATSIGIRVN